MSQVATVGSHATTISTETDGVTRITYHSTVVVQFNWNSITLDTGGYFTSTTKMRMNQASNQFNLGYQVFQKDWAWFVRLRNGDVIPFDDDTLTFTRTV